MGMIRLGCSGWDYRDWADVFYRSEDESRLHAYSRIFNTAEINSTFYSYPSQGIVFGWAKHTPSDFKFSVKLNRLITHEKRLDPSKGVKDDLNRFCELMKPLQDAGKLACILIQLPPGMKFRKDKVEAFLKILPDDLRFAIEYRNKTWLVDEVHSLLSEYDVAAVTVDEPLLPPMIRLTSDLAYVRWHGRGRKMWYNYRYSREELEEWVPRLSQMSQSSEVYGYFNNHYHGYAPENCLEVLEMLGIAVPVQKEAGKHISEYRKIRAGIKTGTRTLSDFEEQEKEDISALLSVHIDAARLEKAKEIKDIEIIESGGDRIVADVSGYSVYIDLEKKFILHDCPDWKRAAKERRFCKHIGALILALPEDAAGKVLGDIKRQPWEFSQYTGRSQII
ncbi:MAG: DUF72 domain-containing protein [Candidatus Methanoperedens sp.]|nr:DUF72 domain-containing protein [Candidatus Methanoperedens sp.]MCZ7359611.1 DUF72 domain-containing protein [Candidatus Methanoperedens sp.]